MHSLIPAQYTLRGNNSITTPLGYGYFKDPKHLKILNGEDGNYHIRTTEYEFIPSTQPAFPSTYYWSVYGGTPANCIELKANKTVSIYCSKQVLLPSTPVNLKTKGNLVQTKLKNSSGKWKLIFCENAIVVTYRRYHPVDLNTVVVFRIE